MLELFRIYGRIDLEGGDKANRTLDQVDGKAKKITTGIGNFARGVGKIAAGIGVFALVGKAIDTVKQSIDGAIDRYDTLNNFPRVLQLMGFDAEDSDKAIKRLSDGIQGLPTRLDEVTKTAQNIAVMTNDLDGAVDTTLALNNAFLASGASTSDAQRGLQQYVQMLAKGEVDLQSWRTLQETMGVALNKLAQEFGFTGASAQNDLYDALKSGEITFDEFNAKLIEASEAQGGFADMASKASGGIKTAWTNLSTWIVTGVADIIGALDEAFGGVGSIEGAINSLKPVVQGTFGWIATTAIPAVADAIQFLKEKFDEYRPTVESVIEKMDPLIQVFQKTRDEIQGQLAPIWENLKELFVSLMPILEMLGAFFGGTLLTAIILWTSALNGAYRAIGPLINALISLVDFIVNVVNTVIALLTGDFTGALEYWNAATEASVEFFKSLWDGIVGFVQGIVETIIGWFEFLYDVLVGNSIIPDMVNAILKWFNNLFKSGVNVIKGFVTGIINFFKNLGTNAANLIRTMVTAVLNFYRNLASTARSIVSGMVSAVLSFFRNMASGAGIAVSGLVSRILGFFQNMLSGITGVARNIYSSVTGVFRNILSFITGLGRSFFNAGRGLVDMIAKGITGAIGKVTGAVRGVVTKVRNMLPFSPAKEGPLSDLDKLDFAGPISDSIEKGKRTIQGKMSEMLGEVHPSVNMNVRAHSMTKGKTSKESDYTVVNKVGDIIINATVRSEQDIDKLTNKLDETLNNLGKRRAAAWGG